MRHKIYIALVIALVFGSIGMAMPQMRVEAQDPLDCVTDVEPTAAAGEKPGDGIPDSKVNFPEQYAKECVPPSLDAAEDEVVRLIYLVWIGSIFAFGLIIGLIGYNYMTSTADTQKQENLKKNGLYAIIGLVVIIGSQPLTAAFMSVFITNDSECFGGLTTPGLTFFFPDVCDPTKLSPKAVCQAFGNAQKCDLMTQEYGLLQVFHCPSLGDACMYTPEIGSTQCTSANVQKMQTYCDTL